MDLYDISFSPSILKNLKIYSQNKHLKVFPHIPGHVTSKVFFMLTFCYFKFFVILFFLCCFVSKTACRQYETAWQQTKEKSFLFHIGVLTDDKNLLHSSGF